MTIRTRNGKTEPLRGGGQNPQTLNFVLRAITKKIKILEKSADYQPNPQYQPKKRLYLYNIIQFCLVSSCEKTECTLNLHFFLGSFRRSSYDDTWGMSV